ncbi:MAG: KEOPS complex subunit Pcc1 [Candidatus Helarchaeota archaeon]
MNSDYNISLEMEVKFKDKNKAKIIYNSIIPEVDFSPNDRSIVHLNLNDEKIVLRVESADFVSLRAVINSYLRWFNLSSKIIEITSI